MSISQQLLMANLPQPGLEKEGSLGIEVEVRLLREISGWRSPEHSLYLEEKCQGLTSSPQTLSET